MIRDYDMIVIGGGAAGLTAAGMSALCGAKTALIEQSRLGGECTWSGCIPSKTLLRAARAAEDTRMAPRFGIAPVEVTVRFDEVMGKIRRTRQHVYDEADAPPNIEKLGVEVIAARARFFDPHTVELQSKEHTRRVTSRYFVIATGSRPKQPVPKFQCFTNESIFEIDVLPERLVILGAGPVGIEMAQAFCRLGSAVTVVAPNNRILAKDDAEHANIVREALQKEGVEFLLGHKARAIEPKNGYTVVVTDDGTAIECDGVLAATGRQPVIELLELGRAGIRTSDRGIATDSHCRTSQKHIFASGDVTGRFQFTHMAEHMSKVAVTNALLRWPQKLDEKHVVWATFTQPELAHLGAREEDLRRRKVRHTVYRFPFHKLDRAITDAAIGGEVKVLADRRGKILGVSIAGEHAGEMIAEYALAMRNNIPLARVSATIHPYPTYMLGNRRVADRSVEKWLDSKALHVFSRFLGYRGQLRGSGVL